jgi:hypothetical protein
MYNQLLFNKLVEKHGVAHVIIYCQMESDTKALLYEECHKRGNVPYEEYMDYAYDRDWWANKAEELKKLYDNERLIGETSLDSK